MTATLTPLEQAYTIKAVCDAWGQSPDYIRKLMREGRIGFIRAGRGRRLLPEHVAQLLAVIEVRPEPVVTPGLRIGQTPASAARRRKSA